MTGPSDEDLRRQVAEVLNRYCQAVDERDAGHVAGYFTEDAELALVGGCVSGRDEIEAAFVRAFSAPRVITRHTLISPVIRLGEHGATASAASGFVVSMWADDGAVSIGAGRYRDELKLGPDGWRFSRKVVDLRIPLTPIDHTGTPDEQGDQA